MSWKAGTRGRAAGTTRATTRFTPALVLASTVAAMTVASPAVWAEELEDQADSDVVDTIVSSADTAPPAPPPAGGQFFDDDNNIFENDIEAIAAEGVTKGCNPPFGTGFCPNDFITRGQMAAFLVRALGYTDNGGGDLFVDDDGSTFEDDLDRLGTAGVTKGCNPPTNDRFCPDDFVTRGQMAAFLTRALELSRPSVSDRPETTNGFDLNVVGAAVESGCTFYDEEVCNIRQSPDGEFFLLTGWIYEDWSSLPSSARANFDSDSVRVEATFDGVPIDLVEFPVEIVDNIAYKSYTYQFPAWLDGDHILEVRFIDDAESYLFTIRDDLSLSGGGYPLTTGSLSTTSATSSSGETQVRPHRSNHVAVHN